MSALVYLPLLVPVLAAAAARPLAARLEPRLATWLLTATTVALAAFSTAALALMDKLSIHSRDRWPTDSLKEEWRFPGVVPNGDGHAATAAGPRGGGPEAAPAPTETP